MGKAVFTTCDVSGFMTDCKCECVFMKLIHFVHLSHARRSFAGSPAILGVNHVPHQILFDESNAVKKEVALLQRGRQR